MTRTRWRVGLVTSILTGVAFSAALAGVPLPGPDTQSGSLPTIAPRDRPEDLLRRAPACGELANDCLVCRRQPDGQPACSTPGIACQPKAWRCIKSMDHRFNSGRA